MIIDKINEALSQLPFTLLGLGLLIVLRGQTAVVGWFALGLGAAAVLGVVLVLALRAGLIRLLERLLLALGEWLNSPVLARISGLDETLRSMYRADILATGATLHFFAWVVGAGEVWLALRFMGQPIDFAHALVIESLGQAVRSAGFAVPAGLGIQEGGYVAVGAALGLPAEVALAVSLVKRVCHIGFGVPGLLSWQFVEARQVLVSGDGRAAIAAPPSSASNAYAHRLARTVLRPLAATRLTPNQLTTLRLLTGLGACAACAVGARGWDLCAGALWLVSALLDRCDGEFARLTGRTSVSGHAYDYIGDVAINALFFLAVGFNLRSGPIGSWSIVLGIVAAATIASASIIAEQVELRSG